MKLQEKIASRMYERAHPQSCQWNDAEIKTKNKWKELASIAMIAMDNHKIIQKFKDSSK